MKIWFFFFFLRNFLPQKKHSLPGHLPLHRLERLEKLLPNTISAQTQMWSYRLERYCLELSLSKYQYGVNCCTELISRYILCCRALCIQYLLRTKQCDGRKLLTEQLLGLQSFTAPCKYFRCVVPVNWIAVDDHMQTSANCPPKFLVFTSIIHSLLLIIICCCHNYYGKVFNAEEIEKYRK